MALVTIGVPVCNGEKYLEAALLSIRDQTFTDFEVIICDNASTDGTEQICRSFAGRDQRFRYIRNKENIGAGPNFNKCFELSHSKYFKWAAHDDLCEPTYLERCVQALERDDSVVLCTTEVVWIDDTGARIRPWRDPLDDIGSPRACRRFRQMSSLNHGCFDVFGVARREALADTPLIASFVGSDRALLAELSLKGRIHRVPEQLFLSRDHRDRSLRAIKLRDRAAWWDPAIVGKPVYPWWRLLAELVKMIRRSPLGRGERSCCYASLVMWARWSWRDLAGEFLLWITGPVRRRPGAGVRQTA